MTDLANIYAHFRPEERSFVDRAAEWVERAVHHHATKRTDFLDPRQAFIVETLARREPGIIVESSGGYASAERKRALIAPDYTYVAPEDFGIALLEITSDDDKFAQLGHGDFLGALLGLGLKREKIGDIHLHQERCHVLVAEEMTDYMNMQLHQVHRAQVMVSVIPLEQLRPAAVEFEELHLSVASLRLDGIVSDVVRLSRAKVLQPIKAGRCKVNWKVEEDPSAALSEGDVVSLQGFGRFKLISVDGASKSGRIRLTIGKYV